MDTFLRRSHVDIKFKKKNYNMVRLLSLFQSKCNHTVDILIVDFIFLVWRKTRI